MYDRLIFRITFDINWNHMKLSRQIDEERFEMKQGGFYLYRIFYRP